MMCVSCGKEMGETENCSMICRECQKKITEKGTEKGTKKCPYDITLCAAHCSTMCFRNISQYDTRNEMYSVADLSDHCPAFAPKEVIS